MITNFNNSVNNNNNNDNNNANKYEPNEETSNKLAIAWVDLTFYGRSIPFRERKTILNGISGSVDFTSLNALMGPSGAGKSTLLKCINGMNMNGVDKNSLIYLSADSKIRSCFIVQDISEHLLMGLTAIQSLIYSSKLKNFKEKIGIDHKSNARKLLSDLMVSDIENTSVNHCSGGEQKRLAIALELTALKKPNLLCIDEPTSGLDSNAAEIVIKCLKDVSRKHKMAIVTSIHQPNNDVLMLFDKLYVLAKGGLCVYEGPPQDLRLHLSAAEFECKEYQVPIEVLLKIASNYDETLQRLANQTIKKKNQLRHRCLTEAYSAPKGIPSKKTNFEFIQMWYLFQRTAIYSFRSQWKAMVIQFVFIVGLGFIVTKLYNEHIGQPDGCFSFASPNSSNTTSSTSSCVKTVEALHEEFLLSQNLRFQFFGGLLIQFLLTVATTLIFATEVKIFLNEHKNGWYSTGSYYWAKTIVELPLCLIITFCYVMIIYKSNHQIDDQNRLIGFMLAITASAICSQGLGFTIGIIASANDKLAIVLAVGVYLLYVMLCGFFAPIEELPEAIQWITHFSYVKQTFEIQLLLIYGFDRCPAGQISSILYQSNLRDETKFWINVLILAFHTFNFRTSALIVLLIKANGISLRFPNRTVHKNRSITIEPIEHIIHM